MPGKYRGSPENQPIQHFGGTGFTPSSESDLLGGDLVPKVPPSLLRIAICVGAACKFKATITRESSSDQVTFNTDTDLTANCLYMFDMLTSTLDEAITFQTDTKEAIVSLTIQEILVGAQ